MSAWTCEKCNWTGRHTQKTSHKRFQCPLQGNVLEAKRRADKAASDNARRAGKKAQAAEEPAPEFWQYLPCLCCGTPVGQVKGQRKRTFVDDSHYDKWRRRVLKEAEESGEPDPMVQRRHSEEVASKVAKEEAIAREAASVPMVIGEASFQLWARCLGLNTGDSASAAA